VTTPLVFLDTETTGLDPARHEVWEIAWAVADRPVESRILGHSLRTADPEALALNGYTERAHARLWLDDLGDYQLRQMLTGVTIVGANPAFDTAFLRARWGAAPWHHRLVDVEAMALALYGWERPRGLQGVAEALRADGHDIPEPDHTAAGDVATTRAVYDALRKMAADR
jgi:DNA polymerase III alpha subunit (gram-positive type)